SGPPHRDRTQAGSRPGAVALMTACAMALRSGCDDGVFRAYDRPIASSGPGFVESYGAPPSPSVSPAESAPKGVTWTAHFGSVYSSSGLGGRVSDTSSFPSASSIA